jgi:hypothetical protein
MRSISPSFPVRLQSKRARRAHAAPNTLDSHNVNGFDSWTAVLSFDTRWLLPSARALALTQLHTLLATSTALTSNVDDDNAERLALARAGAVPMGTGRALLGFCTSSVSPGAPRAHPAR